LIKITPGLLRISYKKNISYRQKKVLHVIVSFIDCSINLISGSFESENRATSNVGGDVVVVDGNRRNHFYESELGERVPTMQIRDRFRE
jgi:hypothetical protein